MLAGAEIIGSRACAEEMKERPAEELAALQRNWQQFGPGGAFLHEVMGSSRPRRQHMGHAHGHTRTGIRMATRIEAAAAGGRSALRNLSAGSAPLSGRSSWSITHPMSAMGVAPPQR